MNILCNKNLQNQSIIPYRGIIVVRYECEEIPFVERVNNLSKSFNIYIFDNSKNFINFSSDKIFYMHDPTNPGLAYGLNRCVTRAAIDRVDACIYFDQDSNATEQLANALFASFAHLILIEPDTILLGPQPLMSNGMDYPVSLKSEVHEGYRFATEIITSGMTFKSQDIISMGFFSEALFLDVIDFEFCWRALMYGKKIFVDHRIRMPHEVGNRSIKLPFKILPISSPFRNYYQTRNIIYLALNGCHGSKSIVLYYIGRRFVNVFINLIFADSRLLRLKYNILGVWDALTGRMGKRLKF